MDNQGTHVSHLGLVLVGYAHTEVAAKGQILDPPHPEVDPELSASTTEQARRRLGVSFEDVRRAWLEGKRGDVGWRLPIDWLCEYFDPEVFKIVAGFITDGPAIAKRRVENYLADYGDQTLPGDVSKEEGLPSKASILRRLSAVKGLMRCLLTLHDDGHESPWLEDWSSPPLNSRWTVPGGRTCVRERRAAPGHIIRRSFRRLNVQIARKLKTEPGDYRAEVVAIRQLGYKQLRGGGLVSLLMQRQILLLCPLLGTRGDATSRLSRRDLTFDRELPDDSVRPAIRVFEWKNKDRSESIWKPIHPDHAQALLPHLEFMDRWLVEVKGCELPGPDGPLLHHSRGGRMRRIDVTRTLGGGRPTRTGRGRLALLRKEGRAYYIGYTAHSCRYRARQWVDSDESRRLLQTRRVDESASWIAEALLGHNANDIRKLYGGGAKPEDVEMLSSYATEINWLMMTTRLGARKELDRDVYRTTVTRLAEAEERQESVETELDSVPGRRRDLRRRRDEAETKEDRLTVKSAQSELDDLEDRTFELNRYSKRLEKEISNLNVRGKDLRQNPNARKDLDDDLLAREVTRVWPDDLDAIDDEVRGNLPSLERRRRRDYLSLHELVDLDGRSEYFFKDLLRKKWPKRIRGVPPWDRAVDPLTSWSTPKRRGILVDKLNPKLPLLADSDKRRRLEELLATPCPEAWGADWEHRADSLLAA